MEKLGEESAAKFINALIKSVQTLCHGYLDFQNGVEIIGHINLSVDKGNSLDYILKEKVCKNAENSTLFISNSFHAEPKPEQEVSGRTSQSGNQVTQNSESPDAAESGRVSSAISSISTALTESKERSRRNSGAKDSSSSHSLPNTAKRKAPEDESCEFRPAKISYHDRLSHVTSESSHPTGTSSPVDSKEALLALRTADTDLSETVLPQTASVRSDSSDIGVNLAGSVLEPVEDQNNPDLQEREEDSDGDLEVTFIKEEYIEGDGSACDFEGQQFARGPHQRASDGMPDPSLFSLGLQPSLASATYVPSAAGQQFPVGGSASSTSQPQPGPSGMRDSVWMKASGTDQMWAPVNYNPFSEPGPELLPQTSEHCGNFIPAAAAPHWMEQACVHRCGTCGMTFCDSGSLRRHQQTAHHPKRSAHQCGLCGKTFTRKESLKDHVNGHRNIKAHQCLHCSRQFVSRANLRKHLRKGFCDVLKSTPMSVSLS